MKTNSEITFDEAIRYSEDYCPIKIYYNKKCIWDDNLEWGKDWISMEDALDAFRSAHKDYDQIVIVEIKIEIVEYHHSVIYLKGKIDKRGE